MILCPCLQSYCTPFWRHNCLMTYPTWRDCETKQNIPHNRIERHGLGISTYLCLSDFQANSFGFSHELTLIKFRSHTSPPLHTGTHLYRLRIPAGFEVSPYRKRLLILGSCDIRNHASNQNNKTLSGGEPRAGRARSTHSG